MKRRVEKRKTKKKGEEEAEERERREWLSSLFSPDLGLVRIFQMHYDVWMLEVGLGTEPLAPQLNPRIFCFFL